MKSVLVLLLCVTAPVLAATDTAARDPDAMLEHPTSADCQWFADEVAPTEAKHGLESGSAQLARISARLCRHDIVITDLAKRLTAQLHRHQGMGSLFSASHQAWRAQRAAQCAWDRAGNTGNFPWPVVEERACRLRSGNLWETRLRAFAVCVSRMEADNGKDAYDETAAYDVAACAHELDLGPAGSIE